MKTFTFLIMAFFGISTLLVSCGESKQTEEATVTEEQSAAEATYEAVTYIIDTTESDLEWTGEKKFVNWGHYGTIDLKSGEIYVNNSEVEGGEFIIDMNSLYVADKDLEDKGITADRPKLEGHLKSDDFFAVEQFPTAKFVITDVQPLEGDPDNTHTISGNLTIRDVTKNISFPASIDIDENNVEATAEFHINRTDFNVKYGSDALFDLAKDQIIKDEIHFDLELVAVKGNA